MAKFVPASRGGALPSMEGATLIIADVSLGNVGQLAADLIVTTLGMEVVAYLDDAAVLPVAGNEVYYPSSAQ
jgi:proteasome assembly chaperone 2